MIDKFSHGFINSVYDFNDYTLNELICKLAQKMDEDITQSNERFNYLDWVKGQGLSDEVIKIMTEWIENGIFDKIINKNIFNELSTKVENGKLKFVGNGTGSWIIFFGTTPINVKYGETIVLGVKWKTTDAKVNLKVNFFCYDEENNLIDTINCGDYQWEGTNGELLIHPAKYNYTVNNNKIKKIKFRFSFSNFTEFEISEVICNIV